MKQVHADMLKSYVKIRSKVKQHRHLAPQQLSTIVAQATSAGELPMLREIAGKLQTKKRQTKAWGNVRKSADRLFRLLPKVQKISKNWWDTDSLNTFVWESFRARLICATSARYGMGSLPMGPVQRQHQPYALYGLESNHGSFSSSRFGANPKSLKTNRPLIDHKSTNNRPLIDH